MRVVFISSNILILLLSFGLAIGLGFGYEVVIISSILSIPSALALASLSKDRGYRFKIVSLSFSATWLILGLLMAIFMLGGGGDPAGKSMFSAFIFFVLILVGPFVINILYIKNKLLNKCA